MVDSALPFYIHVVKEQSLYQSIDSENIVYIIISIFHETTCLQFWILDLRNHLPVWMNRILFPLNLLGLLFSSDTSPLTAFPVYVGSRTTPVVAPIFIMNSTEEIEMIKLRAFHSTT